MIGRAPLFVVVALAVPAAALAATVPSFGAIAHSDAVPYIGELVVNGKTILRVVRGAGEKRRQEVLSPPDMAGDLIVDNGRTRYHYSPRSGRVDLSPSAVGTCVSTDTERLLARNYRLVVGPTELVAGRPALRIDVLPRQPKLTSERVWLDQQTGLALRTERVDPKGKVLERSEFRSVKVLAVIPADTFDFALPPGAKVGTGVQLLASGRTVADLKEPLPFRATLPGYLPHGFEVRDVHLIESRGVRSVHWRISNGLDMISLFQASREHQAPAPKEAHPVDLAHGQGYWMGHGRHRMLCWENDLGAFTLVADLSPEELSRIADSSHP